MKPTLTQETKNNLKIFKSNLGYIKEMTPTEVDEFLKNAEAIVQNPAFKKVLEYLTSQQIDYTVKQASNWEMVLFGRATINGFFLIKDEFEALAAMYRDKIAPKEEFDPHKPL